MSVLALRCVFTKVHSAFILSGSATSQYICRATAADAPPRADSQIGLAWINRTRNEDAFCFLTRPAQAESSCGSAALRGERTQRLEGDRACMDGGGACMERDRAWRTNTHARGRQRIHAQGGEGGGSAEPI